MAISLAQAFVEIVPSMKGVGKAISSAFGDAASTAGSKAGKDMGSSLDTSLSSTLKTVGGKAGSLLKGVGIAAIGAASAAGAGLTAIGKQALEAYATYEQAVGGVDTLFKDASGTVQKYAAEAYKTAGVSANDYMNQVTSFAASLVSSLGGDTAAAAEAANTALVDMSDNANKMGTDLGSLQWAYQGFAKQNYTMLDNLKLGYGGTKAEMQRLIDDANKLGEAQGKSNDLSIDSFADVVEAIHRVQENLDITGTTSREAATTIEGATGMMKAAWTNWLTEIGKSDADMKTLTSQLVQSVITVGKNVAPRIAQIAAGLISGLSAAMGEIGQYLPQPVQAGIAKVQGVFATFTSFLSGWSDKAKALVDIFKTGDFTSGFREAFNVEEDSPAVAMILRIRDTALQVRDAMPAIFSNVSSVIGGAFQSAVGVVSGVFTTIMGIVGQVGKAFSTAFSGNGGTLAGLLSIVTTIMGLVSPLGIVKLLFTQFGGQLTQIASAAIPPLVGMLTSLATLLGGSIAAILPGIQSLLSAMLPVIGLLVTTVGGLVTSMLPMIATVVQAMLPVIMQLVPIITQIVQLAAQLMTAIAPIIAQLASALMPVITNIMSALMNLVTAIMPAVSGIVAIVANIVSVVVSGIQMMLPVIQTVVSVVASVVAAVVSAVGLIIVTVTNIVSVVAGVVSNVVSSVAVVTAIVAGLAAAVASVFQGILTVVGSIVSAIVSAVSAAFQLVVNTISTAINTAGAIISGFHALISKVFQAIGSVISATMNTIAGVIRSGVNIMQSAFTGMVNAASSMAGKLMSLIGSIPGKIRNLFSSAGSWLMDAGRNIISGLWNGISGAIGGLYSNITNALSGLVDKAKNALGIHSPSRVFRDEVGLMIGQGMGEGITDSMGYVRKRMDRLNSVLNPAGGFGYDLSGYTPATAGKAGASVHITNYYPQADPWPLSTNSALDEMANGL
ncbi:hypothetical protein JS533_001710 [Bifidobacterium amazonense]|uniref:Tape measure protein n=1 Tax=Bifidobacterium amazonense TaxID=2809027 RepID=A0ABS9VSD9_9BIFI|nr:hypothetical protein [Bifidobacterium amazonense]MCH9275005.1 hypothetical protein [Bifidobacterium amazonense]